MKGMGGPGRMPTRKKHTKRKSSKEYNRGCRGNPN